MEKKKKCKTTGLPYSLVKRLSVVLILFLYGISDNKLTLPIGDLERDG
jgi:hypothetical protein